MMIECVCRRVGSDVSTTWPAPANRTSRSPAPRMASACSTVTPPAVSNEIAPVEPCRQFGRGQTRYQVHPVVAPRSADASRSPQSPSIFGRYSPPCGIAGGTMVFSPTPPSKPFSRGVACGSVLPDTRYAASALPRVRLVGDAGNRMVPHRQRARARIQHAREGARIPPPAEAGDRVGVRPGEGAAGIGIRVGISSTAQRPPERRPTRRNQHRAAGSDQGNAHDRITP